MDDPEDTITSDFTPLPKRRFRDCRTFRWAELCARLLFAAVCFVAACAAFVLAVA